MAGSPPQVSGKQTFLIAELLDVFFNSREAENEIFFFSNCFVALEDMPTVHHSFGLILCWLGSIQPVRPYILLGSQNITFNHLSLS